MHEFEALLFSDADILAEKTEIDISEIRRIIKEYNNPEEINDDPMKTLLFSKFSATNRLSDDIRQKRTGEAENAW